MAAEGIETRHRADCATRNGRRRCNCTPSYRAKVSDPHTARRIKRTFASETAAAQWRRDVLNAFVNGPLVIANVPIITVGEALDELLARIKDGRTLNRSGEHYRPATVRDYEHTAEHYIRPALGHMHLTDVRRRDVQDLIDELRRIGLSPSSVHNKLDVVRVLFRLAIEREYVQDSPCTHLRLPAVRHQRPEVAGPEQARALIDALPIGQRALWATLFFAGLRIGEVRALRWRNIDFDQNAIRVESGWDEVEGEQDCKTAAGRREVPLLGELRSHLAAHKLATGRREEDLCFGREPQLPFVRSTVRNHARDAWQAAGLEPITPHGARHTCASYLIAAGVGDMDLQAVLGHTDVRTTKNVYGHLMPDTLENVRKRADEYLAATRVP